ncbi:Piso0_003659 [Millerozyma farinosa CBS 7064]|uniref:Piso0_003659 protein n=1 Tax=Pichia sorbitophila (strain ATCC MYA-4447 / BCRC 22081 / CBS 7064 / NBRC 10061 / NRRL Y-12695) TaxID=559304 RepID=G8YJP5_PICSO|nr:Piso0_003659 [Millerozyma farinosa CBS 7064]CCE81305.1 Piso0_003659 [Millerozyma farinosa CBS 7064]
MSNQPNEAREPQLTQGENELQQGGENASSDNTQIARSDNPEVPVIHAEEVKSSGSPIDGTEHISAEASNDEPENAHGDTIKPNREEVDDTNDDEANTSIINIPSSQQAFATPSKSLPPLKDIDPITTPKSFNVARDDENNTASSPILRRDSHPSEIFGDRGFQNDTKSTVCSFLGVDSNQLNEVDQNILDSIYKRSVEFEDLKSTVSFLRISHEKSIQIQNNNLQSIQKKLEAANKQNESLSTSKDSLTNEKEKLNDQISSLKKENSNLSSRISAFESENGKYKADQNEQIARSQEEITRLNRTTSTLMQTNIEQNQKINELTKQINDVVNERFSLKLELTKKSNELSYTSNQKKWYEEELKSVQTRFTELIKTHENDYLVKTNKISELDTKVQGLERMNKKQQDTIVNLQKNLEDEITKSSSLKSKLELDSLRSSKELKNKEELLNLTKLQSSQRGERISQLEAYVDEIKNTMASTTQNLDSEIAKKDEKIIILEEKLKRTEEVLDKELHKETNLPKLNASAEIIASQKDSGISLSALYTEYNHLKKQLVLERSQKDKLASELENFIAELESKKPALANYRDQVRFYENSLNEMVGKVEEIRLEKLESDKEGSRLKSKISDMSHELVTMKKLCKDLGRQLCYYLIHSKIKDSNEEPLTFAEKRAIDAILEKSGNNDSIKESDTDSLISERLVGFVNIIELEQKNQELLVTIRQLGKKLEKSEDETIDNLESAAVEEAKEAILTLQGELDSVNVKLNAITKERDVLKRMVGSSESVSSPSEAKYLTDANNDLKNKLEQTEKLLNELQLQSNETIRDLNDKLREANNLKSEVALNLTSSKHDAELAETKYQNAQKSLENFKQEVSSIKSDIEFWKNQVSKHESQLIEKTNQLRDTETQLNHQIVSAQSLRNENDLLKSVQKTLESDIAQLKSDKSQLNEFVSNLQALLKERDESSKELSSKLSQSITNYQKLQEKLNEKDERIMVLCSQSELAIKSQNSKLEQVYELSQTLLDYKNKLADKSELVVDLKNKIEALNKSKVLSIDTMKFSEKSQDSISSNDLSSSVSSSDLEKLKNDLKIAEGQISELSAIAKGAEDALMQSTNTFESFKADMEARCNSISLEKSNIENELNSLREAFKASENTFVNKEREYITEIQDLKIKLEDLTSKSNSLNQIQADYESKLSSLMHDLQSQSQISSDAEKRASEQYNKNEKLAADLAQLRNGNIELEAKLADLQKSVDSSRYEAEERRASLEEEKQMVQKNLEACEDRIKDLQDQNQILLNQLELFKLPNYSDNAEESSQEDLRKIIVYLRREKEAADSKVSSSKEEEEKLSQRLNQVSSELELTKSELKKLHSDSKKMSDVSQEHLKLKEQLESLNIMRESNITLRNENNQKTKQISTFERELSELREKLAPLENKVNELTMATEFKEQDIRHLKEENDSLKAKLDSSKSGEVNDQSEELNAMKQRFTNLKNEFQNKLSIHRGKTKELEKTVENLKSELAAANENLTKAKASFEEELSNARNIPRTDENNELISKLNNELQESRLHLEKVTKDNEANLKLLENEKSALENEIKELKSQANSISSEGDAVSSEKFKSELQKVKEQFEAEKSEFKRSLESEYESKLREEIAKITQKVNLQQGESTEEDIRKEFEAEFKKKYEDLSNSTSEKEKELEKSLKERLEQEISTKLRQQFSSENSSLDKSFQDSQNTLSKNYEDEISRLKESFAAQLEKEKEEVKNVTEKKFEIKLRMLNKKLDRLEAKKAESNDSPSSGVTGNAGTYQELHHSSSTGEVPAMLTPATAQQSNTSPSDDGISSEQKSAQNQDINKEKVPPLGHQFTESTLTVHRPVVDRTSTFTNRGPTKGPEVPKPGQKRPSNAKGQPANKRSKE